MNKDELMQVLSGHEWNDIEFKEARNAAPKSAYETVSAFANTAGGHLIFGVKEDGARYTAVGVLDFDKVQNEFVSALRDNDRFSRTIQIKDYHIDFDDKDIIVFYVPESKRADKPVYLNGDIRRSFIRKGAADVKCNEEEIKRFMSDASESRYEDRLLDHDLKSCFDEESLVWYRQAYERHTKSHSYANMSDIDFLCKMGLVRDDKGVRKASVASILLFGSEGYFRGFLPRPVVDCQRFGAEFGRYAPSTRWDNRLVLDSNLISSWQSLLQWQNHAIPTPFSVDPVTLQRNGFAAEHEAFREAGVNVLIHQDYSDHCRHPQIRYFKDCFMFENPGDAFASLDDLLEPGAKPVRNPRIVDAFRRIGLSEDAGWGLQVIFSRWLGQGHAPPAIRNNKEKKMFELELRREPLLSHDQLIFQTLLGVSLDECEARLFAYIDRESKVSETMAKAILYKPEDEKPVKVLERLVKKRLVKVIVPGQRYERAKDLLNESTSDHAGGQVSGGLVSDGSDQAIEALVEIFQAKLGLANDHAKVIRLCESPQTTGDLMKELQSKHRSHFRKKVLEPLIKYRLLQQTHPDQPNHPMQEYVLTTSGQRLLTLVLEQVRVAQD